MHKLHKGNPHVPCVDTKNNLHPPQGQYFYMRSTLWKTRCSKYLNTKWIPMIYEWQTHLGHSLYDAVFESKLDIDAV